jgi:putative ABC transport system ATP-binding protein
MTMPFPPPATTPEAVFHIRGVTKVYHVGDVEVHALRGVDLSLYPGEFIVVLGPSGSGKSTLLNILGGLDVPTSGEVHYLDHNLTAAGDAALTRFRREHVGFVFQFYNLIPSLTAIENVALVTEIAERPMDPAEALGLVGAQRSHQSLPGPAFRRRTAASRDRASSRQTTRRPALRRAHWCARLCHRQTRVGSARTRQS